jgi:hypothetical protein
MGWRKDKTKQLSFNVVAPDASKNLIEEKKNSMNKEEGTERTITKKDLTLEGTEHKEEATDLILDLRGRSKFYRGETISGKIVIVKKSKRLPEGSEITLSGIEYSAAGQNEFSTIEKYKQTMELPSRNKDVGTIPFEIEIPRAAKRSYKGKYSSFDWSLNAKVDIPSEFDLKAEAKIEIV